MLEWIIIIIAIAAAFAYLALRMVRWLGARKPRVGSIQSSRPQGLTVAGKRIR